MSTIAIFAAEEDVGTYAIKAVDDLRTLNKVLYLRPSSNILSHDELVSLWEKKTGKTFERVYIPEDEVLKKIQGQSKSMLNLLLSAFICLYHCMFSYKKLFCPDFTHSDLLQSLQFH